MDRRSYFQLFKKNIQKNKKSSLFILEIFLIFLIHFAFSNSYSLLMTTEISSINPNSIISNSNNLLQDKQIGWVVTHGEDAYDNPPFNVYLTTINDVLAMGATLNNITSEINSTLLSNYDILVLEEGGTNWTASELADLESWIINGGSLYILGDNCDDAQTNVSAKFGIYYNSTDPQQGSLNFDSSHFIFQNINTITSFFPSASINSQISVNFMNLAWSVDNASLVIALQKVNGRILWNVDADGMIDDSYISQDDNHVLANNSWLWLGGILGNNNPPNIVPFLLIFLINESIEWPIFAIAGLGITSLVIVLIYLIKRKK